VVAVGVSVIVPLVFSLPDQPPEAVQLVALLEDQVRVADEPLVTLVGLALRLTVGLGIVSVTWTVSAAAVVPLAPLQVSVKVVELVMAPVLALPLVALLPDQPPEAVQLVALLEAQTRVADEPLVTLVGRRAATAAAAAADGEQQGDEHESEELVHGDFNPHAAS
jgi:hypothetical protein